MLNFCFYQYTSYFRSFIDRKAFFTTNHYMSMDKKERLEVGLPTISDAIRVRKPRLASLLRKIQKKRIFFEYAFHTRDVFPIQRFPKSHIRRSFLKTANGISDSHTLFIVEIYLVNSFEGMCEAEYSGYF